MSKSLQEVIKNKKVVRLDLGCGPNKKRGFIGVDSVKSNGVDVVMDLNGTFPIPNGVVDEIYTSHFLEHADNPIRILEECSRVLKEGGILTVIVPHYTNPYAYHFTHKTYWSSYSLDQSYLDYYLNVDLELKSRRINIHFHRIIDPFLTTVSNMHLSVYERILSRIYHAWEVMFVLKKNSKRNKLVNISNLH